MMQCAVRSLFQNMFLLVVLGVTGLVTAACNGPKGPLEALPKGETGRVVRIIDGDALVLDTGLTVRLVGIEAPAPERRNRVGEPYADRSSRALEDLALGRQVRLYYPGITRDRYDRALAYVKTEDNLGAPVWLNLELVKMGAARARLYPDTARQGEHLLAAEQGAREDRRGLWKLSVYDVQSARDIAPDARGFMIITGVAGLQMPSPDDRALCVRTLENAALVLTIKAGAGLFCDAETRAVPRRFRGYVRDGVMEITHILNAEALDQATQ